MTNDTWKKVEERLMKKEEINKCQDPVQMRIMQAEYNDLEKKVKKE
jgi:hypothetical protein